MDILTQIMASPYVSAEFQCLFGDPAAASQVVHIARYRAMIDSRPPMSAEQRAELKQDRDDEERERPGLYEASDARYDWRDAT